MTKQELERGMELQRLIDRLYHAKEELEQREKLLFKDMDRAKESEYIYWLRADEKTGAGGSCTQLSVKAAYSAVRMDIADIDKELERIKKEFSDL